MYKSFTSKAIFVPVEYQVKNSGDKETLTKWKNMNFVVTLMQKNHRTFSKTHQKILCLTKDERNCENCKF